jgi:thiamine biosynthesis lipoprotein
MKRYILIALALLFACLALAFYFFPSRHEAVFYPMGGIPFRVIVYDRPDFKFKSDFFAVQRRVEELENVFNAYKEESELSIINRASKRKPVFISPDMHRVLSRSLEWWKKTSGAFDITLGPLIRVWREAGEKGLPPEDISAVKSSVGSDKISVSDNSVVFHDPRVELGLGGIAKGDIVDQAAKLLQERGVKRGVVDAGGDILAFGNKEFSFGIQDPTAGGNTHMIGAVKIAGGAIVTSGSYERFVEIKGKRYSHIIDPVSGYPADNDLVSATVIGKRCIDADALATALMVMGAGKAVKWLNEHPEFQGILVEKKENRYIVWVSKKLRSQVEFEMPWKERVSVF